jgi:predicted MFS family arabinose efflux permease
LVAVVLAMGISLRPRPAVREHTAFRELVEGLRFAASRANLRLLLQLGTISWLSFGAFAALEPLFFRDVLRVGPEAIGWVNTVFGLGLVAGTASLGKLPTRFVSARTAAVLTGAGGLGAFLYTGTDDLPIVVVGALYWGFVLGMLFPVLRSLVQLATPLRMQGRAAGILELTHNVGELVPLAFVPALAAAFGVQRVLVSSGVVLLVLAAVYYPLAAHSDRVTPATGSPEPLHVADASVDPTAVQPSAPTSGPVV